MDTRLIIWYLSNYARHRGYSSNYSILEEFSKSKNEIIENDQFTEVRKGEVFISEEESDLVTTIKLAREKDYKIGRDIGVLSFNDTPLKEVLEDGISVISTNFQRMGSLAAELILEKRRLKVRNEFSFIRRKSL